MVVDEAASLHERVGCGGAGEAEAARLEFLGDFQAERRLRRHLGEAREAVLDGLAVDEAPEEGGERLLGGQGQIGAGVGDGGFDLAPVADDAGIGEQLRDLRVAVARDLGRVEPVERRAEGLALAQDGDP